MDAIEMRARELTVAMTVEEVAKLISGAPFPSKQSLAKARAVVEFMENRSALTPQWQPIESAPKDGTAVLVMQNNWPGCKNGVAEECNGHNTYVAAWWADERGGAGAWICYMDAVRDPECPIQPTHWQPMPPPPGVS